MPKTEIKNINSLLPMCNIRKINLKLLADRAGSIADINEKLGRSRRDPYLYSVLSDQKNRSGSIRSIGPDMCRQIEKAYSLPDGYLSAIHDETAAAAAAAVSASIDTGQTAQPPALTPAGIVTVQLLDNSGAVSIDAAYLAGRLIITETIAAYYCPDDCMQPALLADDLLLIDTAKTAPAAGVYVLEIDGRLIVRRLSLDVAGAVTITADNLPGVVTLTGRYKIRGRLQYIIRGIRQ